MTITKDRIVKQIASLEQQQAAMRDQYQQVEGALAQCRFWLGQIEKAEAEEALAEKAGANGECGPAREQGES